MIRFHQWDEESWDHLYHTIIGLLSIMSCVTTQYLRKSLLHFSDLLWHIICGYSESWVRLDNIAIAARRLLSAGNLVSVTNHQSPMALVISTWLLYKLKLLNLPTIGIWILHKNHESGTTNTIFPHQWLTELRYQYIASTETFPVLLSAKIPAE